MSWTIDLPWPKPPLSLNDRGQTRGARQARSALIARMRGEVAILARAARIPACGSIHVRLHYRPKDRTRRDPENLIPTQKPCIDALVDAGVVSDDSPDYVDWSRPQIHRPALDRTPRMWLEIREVKP